MRDCSIPIWQLLLAGKKPTEIALLFSEKYSLPIAEIFPSLQLFLKKLIDEAMLAPIDSLSEIKTESPPIYWPEKFNVPVLESYQEMKDLLMIDPVHEVDEQGWPVKSV